MAFARANSELGGDKIAGIPSEGIAGLKQNWKTDMVSGLLVSLIALPLCLAISMASGFPAFGGLVTAMVGGLLVAPFCGSRLTIKGPAAGLIAIAVACVEILGQGTRMPDIDLQWQLYLWLDLCKFSLLCLGSANSGISFLQLPCMECLRLSE